MSTGLGWALLGIWLFVAAAFTSRRITSGGMWIALITGIGMSIYFIQTSSPL